MILNDLTFQELNYIANNFTLTNHARERLEQRFGTTNTYIIKKTILSTILGYRNTDGSYNIAINEWEYFVVVVEELKPRIITFKEKSLNNINIYQKYEMAQRGIERIPTRLN